MSSKRELVTQVLDETVLQPECLKQYASLTGTPYLKSAEHLRVELGKRGKLARRGDSYISITVWGQRSYRVHIRRDEQGFEGYRLERLNTANASNTGQRKPRKRRLGG
jgi:hypothetical protein